MFHTTQCTLPNHSLFPFIKSALTYLSLTYLSLTRFSNMLFRDTTTSSSTSSSTPISSSKTYLNVPFSEKDEAKSLGARWDNAQRKWYAPNGESALVERWGTQARPLETLEGEDRTFGQAGLHIDLFPKSCWCKKIRFAMDRDEADRVQDLVLGRVNRTCEACGIQDVDKRFDMHGRWSYDDATKTQTLVRLVAMCEDCFDVTHFGAASYAGRRDRAMAHWQHVTGRTYEECKLHIDQAYARMHTLNETDWKVDVSLLTRNGVSCRSGDGRGGGGSWNKGGGHKGGHKDGHKKGGGASSVQHRGGNSSTSSHKKMPYGFRSS